ncbi:MAG TPA: sulfite exporter TauE/SafE family protein [Xanthobacteraceae bacterium]|nr:sulfite exporter TauE/SafE family protein [Xanthobacteraceae bacterium]
MPPPEFFLFAVPAVVILGLAKGGFTGLGALGLPLFALGVDPIKAAAVLLPILIVQDVVSIGAYRRTWNADVLISTLPGAAVGVVIGWWFAASVSVELILAAVGAIAILFGCYRLWVDFGHHALRSRQWPRWTGPLFGIGSGFTSQIAHAGGPPFQLWVMPKRLPRDIFVGTTAIFFGVLNWLKVPAYVALGQFTHENMLAALVLAPVAIASSLLGVRLVRAVPGERYYLITYILLVATGIKLLFDAAY